MVKVPIEVHEGTAVQGVTETRRSAQRHPTLRSPTYLRHVATKQQRPPKYVQELLGHASISQTLDTYSHVLKGMDSGIGDAMDVALG